MECGICGIRVNLDKPVCGHTVGALEGCHVSLGSIFLKEKLEQERMMTMIFDAMKLSYMV